VSRSLIYRSAGGYELLMRLLYGRHYGARLKAIAEEVPPGCSVLELCCGPGTLYTRCLRGRVSSYVGLDLNERFVTRLRRQGVDARRFDLASAPGPLPGAEVAIIQASLYQFLPDARQVIERMLAAAARLVIVSEPIRNLAASENRLLGLIGRRAADPGTGAAEQRFTERTLDELFAPYRQLVLKARLIPGGREKLYVLRPRSREA
jgi:SAM-dependent methyltransferase